MACIYGIEQDCSECRMCAKDVKKKTNAEIIRNMNNKELAKFLCEKFCHGVGEDLIKEWLESECDTE